MRIKSQRVKRRWKKKKKREVATRGFERASQLPPAKKRQHLTTGPCDHYAYYVRKLINLKFFSLPFTPFAPYGAVFIMNSKIHLRKNSSNEYFKTISHYLRVYSLSGFTVGRSINGLVFFFAAFAEVQVAVLSVLNLPRQGFPATCPVGHCCACNPRLFPSEIFCDLPTYNKQRMNKMSPNCCTCCLETQNARWRHVAWRL